MQLLYAEGAGNIVAGDRAGAIHRGETCADPHRQRIADNTNPEALPGLFRGLFAASARDITTPMLVAARRGHRGLRVGAELNARYIVPSVFDTRVAPAVAAAVIATVPAKER